MNTIQFVKVIVGFISIVAVVNGNLITLDGLCPSTDLKPAPITLAMLKGTSNIIAETGMTGAMNRTDLKTVMKSIANDEVQIQVRFQSVGTDKCHDIYVNLKDIGQPGAFDAQYQVAPDTGFVGYKGYFLSIDPETKISIGLICHDLPDSKHQALIAVMAPPKTEFDEATRSKVKQVLEENNISYLFEHVQPITHTNSCNF